MRALMISKLKTRVFKRTQYPAFHNSAMLACIKDMGKKWKEREEGFENEYFWRKNKELLLKLREKLERKLKEADAYLIEIDRKKKMQQSNEPKKPTAETEEKSDKDEKK